jgi:peptidoglycan/LPS O-acetylase OafA/YrhL
MRRSHLPAIQWQAQSQLDSNSVHSLLISLMRGLAALQVAAAHLRSEMFPGLSELANPPLVYQVLAYATGLAHQAVIVFFLISGWLVGGSLLNKFGQPGALRSYAIDRATRLWTVLLPALCLMLAVGVIVGAVDPGQPDFSTANAYSAASFAGNLLGLQTVLVNTYAGNYALWSLANETWYYLQFPLLLVVFMGKTRLRQAAAALVLILLANALPFPIMLYFALWLLGAAFSRIRIECGPAARVALLAAAVACVLYSRLRGNPNLFDLDSFALDLAYGLPLLAYLSSMQRPLNAGAPWTRRIAPLAHLLSEFSFTLYVIHVPIIRLMRHVGMEAFGRGRLSASVPLDYAIYFGMLLILLLAAYLSYLLFESHTFRIRRAVKSALQPRRQRTTMASASAE